MAKKMTHHTLLAAMPTTLKGSFALSRAETDIDRAVEKVYGIYGHDLSVFFAAVRQQARPPLKHSCELEQLVHHNRQIAE
jgi:hypothetical protein